MQKVYLINRPQNYKKKSEYTRFAYKRTKNNNDNTIFFIVISWSMDGMRVWMRIARGIPFHTLRLPPYPRRLQKKTVQ